ncbi:MAG: DUF1566 domain-containing protein [Treponema sp.]|jgi:TolB-like protein|nr:DUF1566 domain-containing protein [Treponema sp.]
MKKRSILLGVLLLFAVFAASAQPVVAVAPFDAISGISATEANMITRVFFIRLGNTNRVRLVDRNVVDRVIQEHRFQAGDWSNQQKTAELAKAMNANWIVRGELEKFGNSILVTVQFYDIQTFQFMGGSDVRIANADAAYDNMDPLVNKLVETISTTGRGPTGVSAVSGSYRIGDKGPGGGTIFSARDGKYMECSDELGTANWSTARILAQNYDGGGLHDWRLPTKDELNLMYVNLKLRNLGGFSDGWYWSSSEGSSGNAWLQRFSDGYQSVVNKTDTYRVRAVRSF